MLLAATLYNSSASQLLKDISIFISTDGEPVLRFDVHRSRPGIPAAWRPGAIAVCRPGRLPQHFRRALHPSHAVAADRASRLALAAARVCRALLLPIL